MYVCMCVQIQSYIYAPTHCRKRPLKYGTDHGSARANSASLAAALTSCVHSKKRQKQQSRQTQTYDRGSTSTALLRFPFAQESVAAAVSPDFAGPGQEDSKLATGTCAWHSTQSGRRLTL